VKTDGREWLVDAHGCDPARVADVASLQSLFALVIDELHLTPVADAVWHVFPPPAGITGLVPLSESHLTVHSFPEHRSLCINLFCCRARPEWAWAERLGEHVGATRVEVRCLERRYASLDGGALPESTTELVDRRPASLAP
jgi:S-adenosylmethionine decarboxylase